MGFGNVQVSNEKGPLVGLGDLLGIVLPSYVGIVRTKEIMIVIPMKQPV